ncbi:hypothetical protein GGX14DRAFT_387215 [Mycena pura]|uniref:Uncharacterized protein n=1 Tax=Mycena pura TaxID=153505 RepID=A0AAD6YNJ8_9AGAR|nr:hypothetical protein GGX14DRAFT_387215 [Mycena pura]
MRRSRPPPPPIALRRPPPPSSPPAAPPLHRPTHGARHCLFGGGAGSEWQSGGAARWATGDGRREVGGGRWEAGGGWREAGGKRWDSDRWRDRHSSGSLGSGKAWRLSWRGATTQRRGRITYAQK